ncbi:hypothetical protein L9F63_005503, partial [Diploptera punctata]
YGFLFTVFELIFYGIKYLKAVCNKFRRETLNQEDPVMENNEVDGLPDFHRIENDVQIFIFGTSIYIYLFAVSIYQEFMISQETARDPKNTRKHRNVALYRIPCYK